MLNIFFFIKIAIQSNKNAAKDLKIGQIKTQNLFTFLKNVAAGDKYEDYSKRLNEVFEIMKNMFFLKPIASLNKKHFTLFFFKKKEKQEALSIFK